MVDWNPRHMQKEGDPNWTNPPVNREAEEAHRIAMQRAPEVMAVRAQMEFRLSSAGRALAEASTVEARAATMRAILRGQGLAVPMGALEAVPPPEVQSPAVQPLPPAMTPEQVVAEIQAAAAAEKGGKR